MCVCVVHLRETCTWMWVSVQQSVFFWEHMLHVCVLMCMHHIQYSMCESCKCSQCLYRWRKVACHQTTSEILKPRENINHNSDTDPTRGIPIARFLYQPYLRDICHAQHCKPRTFFSVYKSLCYCLLGYFRRDHLNKSNSRYHKTLILFRNNIVRVVLFLLTHHIVILWHECNMAHSAFGNLFSSIAYESNPTAWCVVSCITKPTWIWWKFAHSARPAFFHHYITVCTNASYCMTHEPLYLGTSLIPY